MTAFGDVLEQLRENQPQGKYGIAFEKLMVNFFRTAPTLASQFDEVYRWGDWRYNGGKADTGIDLVAHRIDDDSWVAIQAKFYKKPPVFKRATLTRSLRPVGILSRRRRAKSTSLIAKSSPLRTNGPRMPKKHSKTR